MGAHISGKRSSNILGAHGNSVMWCKLAGGFVSNAWDCEGCRQCENSSTKGDR